MVQDIALPVQGGQVQVGVNERGQVFLGVVLVPEGGEAGQLLTASVSPDIARYIIAALEGSVVRAEAVAERPTTLN